VRQRLTTKSTALLAALCFFAGSVQGEEIVTREFDGFTVVHLASLPDAGVDEIANRTRLAIERVSAWLEQADSYPGSPFEGPLRVLIDPDTVTPTQMKSTLFVPERRVRDALENDAFDTAEFGIVHEVTHALAVSSLRAERNRFYDDGLAVYLQQKFGPYGNYPALGAELHVATAALAEQYGALLPLAEADQARRGSGRRRLGYLQLGSFTQYLVENFGVNAYFRMYTGADPAVITGASLDELETRWARLITALK